MVDIEVVDAGAPPWPLVPDPAWTSTVAPSLPFLQWHEHVALRLVGMTTLEMPASPFFSLFLRTGGGHAAIQRARITKYDEGDWRDDRAAAGKVRRVTYEVDVVDDASRSRRVAVHETQRSSRRPTATSGANRGGGCEAVARGGAGGADVALRPAVRRRAGLLHRGALGRRGAAGPAARAPGQRLRRRRSPDGPGGGWTDEAHRRFDAWHAVATRETYANAVGAMVSDSVARRRAAAKRKQGDAEPRPFVAPVPPSRVDFMTQLEEPPLVRERAPATGPADEPSPLGFRPPLRDVEEVEARGDAAKPAKKSGLGCGEAPWAAGAVPASLLSPKRASGSTYEIVFDGVVGLQFADLGTGASSTATRATERPTPPGVGSALTSVNGVRVGGLTFQSAMALAGQRAAARAGLPRGDARRAVDTLLVERGGGCDARAVDAALAAPGARTCGPSSTPSWPTSTPRTCAGAPTSAATSARAMFRRAVDFAVDQLREKRLLASGSPQPQQNKTAALRVSRRDDDAEERDDAHWAPCRKSPNAARGAPLTPRGASPEAGAGDDELRVHFHSLRFLRLEHLGVVVPAGKARGQTSAPGPEKNATCPTSQAPLSAVFHSACGGPCSRTRPSPRRRGGGEARAGSSRGRDPLGLGSGLDATPLSAAIVSRDRDAIAKCLGRLSIEGASNGADDRVELECHDVDNARPSDGATALMVAASVGDLDVVLALLALGADGNRRADATGRTAARRGGGTTPRAEVLACAAPTPAALLRACAVGDAAAVRGLLLRGADPAAKVGAAAAVASRGAARAALLAADGVDVDATCAKGSTALMRCVGFDALRGQARRARRGAGEAGRRGDRALRKARTAASRTASASRP
ncbi:hypothetical protein JL720_13562 [Aureococcus anophagefferens]|nr:hypothetical protein JL720_13562 [Aureococcus anophagefferens]